MEVKIPKEIRSHRESIFFGLSLRQFICSLGAVMVAVIVYLALTPVVGKEMAGWVCILAAAPIAVCAFVKSQILCARGRGFVSENFYYTALGRKERDDFD